MAGSMRYGRAPVDPDTVAAKIPTATTTSAPIAAGRFLISVGLYPHRAQRDRGRTKKACKTSA